MAEESTIKCVECGFENETQRIYCHNCGTKLDRSLLPPDVGRVESAERRAKRVRRMVNPKPGPVDTVVVPAIKSLLFAAIAAGLILMARPPSALPKMPTKEESIEARVLGIRIEDHLQSRQVTTLSVDEPLANRYLVASVRRKKGGLLGDEFKLEAVSVDFEPNRCLVWAHCSLFAHPLYFGAAFDFVENGGGVEPKPTGAYIGGIAIHPVVVKYAVMPFAPVWEQLKREERLVLQMQKIKVEKDRILLTTPPPGTP
jgi:hypothetical protein